MINFPVVFASPAFGLAWWLAWCIAIVFTAALVAATRSSGQWPNVSTTSSKETQAKKEPYRQPAPPSVPKEHIREFTIRYKVPLICFVSITCFLTAILIGYIWGTGSGRCAREDGFREGLAQGRAEAAYETHRYGGWLSNPVLCGALVVENRGDAGSVAHCVDSLSDYSRRSAS